MPQLHTDMRDGQNRQPDTRQAQALARVLLSIIGGSAENRFDLVDEQYKAMIDLTQDHMAIGSEDRLYHLSQEGMQTYIAMIDQLKSENPGITDFLATFFIRFDQLAHSHYIDNGAKDTLLRIFLEQLSEQFLAQRLPSGLDQLNQGLSEIAQTRALLTEQQEILGRIPVIFPTEHVFGMLEEVERSYARDIINNLTSSGNYEQASDRLREAYAQIKASDIDSNHARTMFSRLWGFLINQAMELVAETRAEQIDDATYALPEMQRLHGAALRNTRVARYRESLGTEDEKINLWQLATDCYRETTQNERAIRVARIERSDPDAGQAAMALLNSSNTPLLAPPDRPEVLALMPPAERMAEQNDAEAPARDIDQVEAQIHTNRVKRMVREMVDNAMESRVLRPLIGGRDRVEETILRVFGINKTDLYAFRAAQDPGASVRVMNAEFFKKLLETGAKAGATIAIIMLIFNIGLPLVLPAIGLKLSPIIPYLAYRGIRSMRGLWKVGGRTASVIGEGTAITGEQEQAIQARGLGRIRSGIARKWQRAQNIYSQRGSKREWIMGAAAGAGTGVLTESILGPFVPMVLSLGATQFLGEIAGDGRPIPDVKIGRLDGFATGLILALLGTAVHELSHADLAYAETAPVSQQEETNNTANMANRTETAPAGDAVDAQNQSEQAQAPQVGSEQDILPADEAAPEAPAVPAVEPTPTVVVAEDITTSAPYIHDIFGIESDQHAHLLDALQNSTEQDLEIEYISRVEELDDGSLLLYCQTASEGLGSDVCAILVHQGDTPPDIEIAHSGVISSTNLHEDIQTLIEEADVVNVEHLPMGNHLQLSPDKDIKVSFRLGDEQLLDGDHVLDGQVSADAKPWDMSVDRADADHFPHTQVQFTGFGEIGGEEEHLVIFGHSGNTNGGPLPLEVLRSLVKKHMGDHPMSDVQMLIESDDGSKAVLELVDHKHLDQAEVGKMTADPDFLSSKGVDMSGGKKIVISVCDWNKDGINGSRVMVFDIKELTPSAQHAAQNALDQPAAADLSQSG